jgi:hypothetical protein
MHGQLFSGRHRRGCDRAEQHAAVVVVHRVPGWGDLERSSRVSGVMEIDPCGTSEEDLSSSTNPIHPSDQPVLKVRASQDEYTAACTLWFSDTVQDVGRGLDDFYAQISWQRVESVPNSVVSISEAEEMVIHSESISADAVSSAQSIIDGDFADIHDNVVTVAEQLVRQTLKNFFGAINAITNRTGNSVEAGGDAIEGLLEALDKTDIRFDANGNPIIQIVTSPEVFDRISPRLEAATPDQRRRFKEILDRKKAQFLASRRARRLPRHSY